MEYKGYCATVEYEDDAELFRGEVINTRDIITFQGRPVPALGEHTEDILGEPGPAADIHALRKEGVVG